MAGSPFYARIKRDVLAIAAAVPEGRVVTFKEVGAHLDVMPRHVAYILRMLEPQEKDAVGWYRVVPDDGRLQTVKTDGHGRTQAHCLQDEGWVIDADGSLVGFERRRVEVATLDCGVPKQNRPADAPRAPARRPQPRRTPAAKRRTR